MSLAQGQFLRAAIMEGWKLERIKDNIRIYYQVILMFTGVDGNHMRMKWREICEKMSNNVIF